MIEIGIDVGGTFTDIVLIDRDVGRIEVAKTASTPEDQSIGILNAMERIGVDASTVQRFTHGTTVATNTALERKGARVGMLTTRGFEDLVEIGRTNRSKVYDLRLVKPAALVESKLRFGITERAYCNGDAPVPPSRDDIVAAFEACKEAGVEALAVCYLHSYLDDVAELETAKILRELDPDLHISTSAEVVREYKEYERFSTALLNAYVMPVMDRYIGNLESKLQGDGYNDPIEIMRSSGGLMSAQTARERPAETLLSGPAAGVMGAVHISLLSGIENIITYDMGGTSTDVALITEGKVVRTPETRISNLPLKTNMIDVKSIGAGGGSIARVGLGDVLAVGPHSAGASPGPACYGKGGVEPTVTDANMALGRLAEGGSLSGEINLDGGKAKAAIDTIGTELNLETAEMAAGVLRLVTTAMASAVREISIQRGHDPRDFALVAFGGAGPMHGCDVARDLGIPSVLVPLAPGNLCAFGLLATDIVSEQSGTVLRKTAGTDPNDLRARYDGLRETAGAALIKDGVAVDDIAYNYAAEMRYVGQKSELSVPVDVEELDAASLNETFFGIYAERYGHTKRVAPTEIVNIRVMSVSTVEKPNMAKMSKAGQGEAGDPVTGTRQVYFDETGWIETHAYNRDLLRPGRIFNGPAIVEELGATTVIGPNDRFSVDEAANMIVEIDIAIRENEEAA